MIYILEDDESIRDIEAYALKELALDAAERSFRELYAKSIGLVSVARKLFHISMYFLPSRISFGILRI